MADAMADLIAAAQAEGGLTTIALPYDWCNYGEVISSFTEKYGIPINELDPNAGSGDEIEAVKANMNNPGPQAPDVIDVGFGFGPQLVEEGITQPYQVSTWDTIPDNVKNADGYWYGDYYGVLGLPPHHDVGRKGPPGWAHLRRPRPRLLGRRCRRRQLRPCDLDRRPLRPRRDPDHGPVGLPGLGRPRRLWG